MEMSYERLSDDQCKGKLAETPGWAIAEKRLVREISGGSYAINSGFAVTISLIAEKLDHHPEILLEYGKVTISTWTHTTGGLTGADFTLAQEINKALPAN